MSSDSNNGVEVPPPPARYETLPASRAGYTWHPGYWEWRNANHYWVVGRWMPERRGYHWRGHRWVHRDQRWFLEPGDWVADDSSVRSAELPQAVRRPR